MSHSKNKVDSATVKHEDVVSKLYPLIEDSKEKIISEWLCGNSNDAACKLISINRKEIKDEFVAKVFDYFLEIVEAETSFEECPVTKKMIRYFQAYNISTKDIFIICTGLKDAIIRFLITSKEVIEYYKQDPDFLKSTFWEAIAILNNHFSNLLIEYTNTIYKKQKDLNRYSKLIEDNVIMSMTDKYGRITYVSDAFCELTEYSKEELLGKPHNIVRHPETPKEIFKDMWEIIQSGKSWKGKISNLKKSGDIFIAQTVIMPVMDNNGEIEEYISIRHDITDKVNAYQDPLTKAFNRRKFEDELETFFIKAHSENMPLSLIIIDIDDFKAINDEYGHQKGDDVLVKTSECIKTLIRKSDIFARWGGEEFVVLMPESSLENAVNKAEKIRESIENLGFKGIRGISCSMGVAQLQKKETKAGFIKRADEFLYKAKKSGKNRVVFTDEQLGNHQI